MLLQQAYFEQLLLPKIKLVTGEKAEPHMLLKLTVANDGQLPIKMYTKPDITYLGLKVPNVGMLIVEDPTQVLDWKHQSKLPVIVGWNLIWMSYNAFVKNMGHQGLTLLHVWRELILFFSPNYVSITLQTYVKVIHWE